MPQKSQVKLQVIQLANQALLRPVIHQAQKLMKTLLQLASQVLKIKVRAVRVAAVQLSAPWGLDRVDQRLLPLTSSFNDGDNSANGVGVYVVDTGINTLLSEFEGRLTAGYSAVAGGIEDCNGHGTHVAGTIARRTYGIAKSATIVPVRVLDCAGSGTYSSVIAGLDWIAASAPAGVPAVVNMSLGGPASATNTINGTSMAAPHVAGIIARFIAANPSLFPSQVASSLKSGATQDVIGSVGSATVDELDDLRQLSR